jgi:N-acetylglucosamine repressor
MESKTILGDSTSKEDHRIRIINCIRKFGPVSRTEIYEMTKISKPTITRVIDDYIEKGVIRETGVLTANSKRKPIGIELNPDAYYCIGVNISKNVLRAILTDFTMNIVAKKQVSIKTMDGQDSFLSILSDSIEYLINKSEVDQRKLLGIGIGVPGIVDNENGVIIDFASIHSMVNVKLKEFLENRFRLSVFVDNDANTQALGEYWYGYSVGCKNSIFVSCREGIGSGIITDGVILRGKSNVTGEFGHMIVNALGRKCNCGRYGCIEAYCSTESIENITREYLRRGRKSSLCETANEKADDISYKKICRHASEGDRLCLERLQEAANILSIGLANLIDIINPEIIILSGDLFDGNDIFYNMVAEYTLEKLFSSYSQDVTFKKREINDTLYEVGAAAMVYKNYFLD